MRRNIDIFDIYQGLIDNIKDFKDLSKSQSFFLTVVFIYHMCMICTDKEKREELEWDVYLTTCVYYMIMTSYSLLTYM